MNSEWEKDTPYISAEPNTTDYQKVSWSITIGTNNQICCLDHTAIIPGGL